MIDGDYYRVVTLPTHPAVNGYTGFLLRKVSTASFEAFSSITAAHGLHPMHFGMLSILEADGPISQQELSERTGVDPSTMVARNDVLEAHGLIERRRSETDRRTYEIKLTADGSRTLGTLRSDADALMQNFFRDLDARGVVGAAPDPDQARRHRRRRRGRRLRALMAEGVVFDLDGVLLDSEQEWSGAKRELTESSGGDWTAEAEEAMLGMSSTEWSRWMRDELGLDMSPDEISDAVVEILAERYRRSLPVLPGADAAVRALAAEFPLGLASSSNREIIDLVLEAAGWAELFAVTVSSEEVAAGKPAPNVYLEACGRLGVEPVASAAIEDSGPGIESAAAAGLAVVAVPNPHYPPPPEALRRAAIVLDSLRELSPETIRRLPPAPAR